MGWLRPGLSVWHRQAMEYAGSPESIGRIGGVVVLGYAIGLVLAYIVGHLLPINPAPLEEARRYGIVSWTTFAGYAKSHEWTIYLVSESIVILVPIATWWGWSLWCGSHLVTPPSKPKRGTRGRNKTWTKQPAVPPRETSDANVGRRALISRGIELMLISSLVVFIVFDINRFGTYWRDTWTFLSEEGIILANVDSLLRGKMLYRDDFALYGPLLFYPVKWIMQLFYPSIMLLRIYFVALDCLGFLVLYYALRRSLYHRGWALFGLGFFLLNFSFPYASVYRPSIHESVLRFAIGLAWLAVYCRSRSTPKQFDLVATGMMLGVALVFSHEVGIVACLACLVVWASGPLWTKRKLVEDLYQLVGVGLGLALILVPVMMFYAVHGSLGHLIYTLFIYPVYMSLGYGGLPFPTPADLWLAIQDIFSHPLSTQYETLVIVKAYWIPWMVSVGSVILGIRLLLGQADHDDRIVLGLIISGGMLFRVALGRSDIAHFQMPLVPAAVMGLMLLRRLSNAIRGRTVPPFSSTVVVGILISTVSFLILLPPGDVSRRFIGMNTWSLGEKVRSDDAGQWRLSDIPRGGGISLPAEFGEEFEQVVRYVVMHTLPNEPIVAFPNEAAYYFFADRPNASRFSFAYLAVTRGDRVEMIRDWEGKNVRYIIYSLATYRVDGIHERIQVPELYDYIKHSYAIEQRIGNTLIMRRRGS